MLKNVQPPWLSNINTGQVQIQGFSLDNSAENTGRDLSKTLPPAQRGIIRDCNRLPRLARHGLGFAAC